MPIPLQGNTFELQSWLVACHIFISNLSSTNHLSLIHQPNISPISINQCVMVSSSFHQSLGQLCNMACVYVSVPHVNSSRHSNRLHCYESFSALQQATETLPCSHWSFNRFHFLLRLIVTDTTWTSHPSCTQFFHWFDVNHKQRFVLSVLFHSDFWCIIADAIDSPQQSSLNDMTLQSPRIQPASQFKVSHDTLIWCTVTSYVGSYLLRRLALIQPFSLILLVLPALGISKTIAIKQNSTTTMAMKQHCKPQYNLFHLLNLKHPIIVRMIKVLLYAFINVLSFRIHKYSAVRPIYKRSASRTLDQ